jgi:hypothetical protein
MGSHYTAARTIRTFIGVRRFSSRCFGGRFSRFLGDFLLMNYSTSVTKWQTSSRFGFYVKKALERSGEGSVFHLVFAWYLHGIWEGKQMGEDAKIGQF